MPSTRQVRRRIQASQNISKITKAMEMVAASKMRRAQDQATAARPYAHALQASLAKVGYFSDPSLHPLLSQHQAGKDLFLLISTDKGLCGGLNTNLFKTTLHAYRGSKQPAIVAVGKKAVVYAKSLGLTLYAQFTNLPEKIQTQDILPISALIIQGFLDREFRSVQLVYMDFINTLTQQVRVVQLLPLTPPTTNNEAGLSTPEIRTEYTFEPDAQTILNTLLPYYIENTLYQSFLEARASEHSARMVAMKSASDNASDLVKELRLVFNKSRQASITTELLDITTATLSLKGSSV